MRRRAHLFTIGLLLLCLTAGCGPKAVLINNPSIRLTPTPRPTATAARAADAEYADDVYAKAIVSLTDGDALAISLGDYAAAFNAYAKTYGFPYALPSDLGVGDKRTIEHEFAEDLRLTFSLSEGWIVRVELRDLSATPDRFEEIRAGGIAVLLAADPILDARDIDMLLVELGLDEEAVDTQGSLTYDNLAFLWEITDEDSVFFSVVPDPSQEEEEASTPTP